MNLQVACTLNPIPQEGIHAACPAQREKRRTRLGLIALGGGLGLHGLGFIGLRLSDLSNLYPKRIIKPKPYIYIYITFLEQGTNVAQDRAGLGFRGFSVAG